MHNLRIVKFPSSEFTKIRRNLRKSGGANALQIFKYAIGDPDIYAAPDPSCSEWNHLHGNDAAVRSGTDVPPTGSVAFHTDRAAAAISATSGLRGVHGMQARGFFEEARA
jgi:hypothetical protein